MEKTSHLAHHHVTAIAQSLDFSEGNHGKKIQSFNQ